MVNLDRIDGKIDLLSKQISLVGIPFQRVMLNSDEAAVYLGIAKSTLYKHTSKGSIAFYKPNGKLVSFKKQDLDAWLESKRIPSNEELAGSGPSNHSFQTLNPAA